ncbi:MAG: hypothetical protein JAZ17_19980 [Candidatus Thiodiazotropha endolucinida]|nr:hypothetical protein [Candidatus Thiodiazotropha endolucinida]
MKNAKVRMFFTGKMKFKQHKQSKHDNYVPAVGEKIGLPRLFTVSRSSGEMHRNAIKNNARLLGLNEHEFKTAVPCGIGRRCCLIGLCTSIIDHCVRQLELDPIAHREGSHALARGVKTLLLASAAEDDGDGPNDDEQKVLDKLRARLQVAENCGGLKSIANEVLLAIERFEACRIG